MEGIVPEDAETLGAGVGAGVRKEDTALKEKLNAGIAALTKAGKFDEITAKYPEIKDVIVTPKM